MNNIVIDPFLVKARRACVAWGAVPLSDRLAVIRRARVAIVRAAPALAETLARPAADSIAAEIMPLAASCRFLERAGPRVRARRRAA